MKRTRSQAAAGRILDPPGSHHSPPTQRWLPAHHSLPTRRWLPAHRSLPLRWCTLLAAFAALALVLRAGGDAALAAVPDGAAAAPSSEVALYDVEMVVFRAASIGPAEDWDVVPPGRGFGSNPGRPGEAPEVLRVLPPSDYRLDGIARRLRSSGAWYPIAHAAWVQTAASWGTHVGIPLSTIGVNVPGLNGTVYLERAPLYLHLGFDVSLQGAATYTINEMRNIRADERQYFDHPAFGIIAVVRAVRRADEDAR